MTEKRFKYVEFTRNIISFDDNGVCKFFNERKFEDWLNELNDENKELKKESYGNLDGLETYKALYLDLSEKYDNLEADFDDLRKENEQLKSDLKLYEYKNAHDYKDEEFPKPLQKRRE